MEVVIATASPSGEIIDKCVVPGTHDPEPTTLLCSCNGVFTDRFIFRLNFPQMRLPQEPDDQLQEIKLTS